MIDFELSPNYRHSPLVTAIRLNNKKMVEVLLDFGSEIHTGHWMG